MARSSFHPLAPGVRLMRRLRVPVKLALMGLALLVPLTVLVVTRFMDSRNDIGVARQELVGARQVSTLVDLVAALQAHRDAAMRNADTAKALAAVKEHGALLDDPALVTADIAVAGELRRKLAEMAGGQLPKARAELFAVHSRTIALAEQQLQLTAEASGLLLDPEAQSYYLMDLATTRLVPWLEALSAARGQGAAVLTRGEATNSERATLLIQAERIDRAVSDMQVRLDSLRRTGMEMPPAWQKAAEASRGLAAQIRSIFTEHAITAEVGPYFDLATGALEAGAGLKRLLVDDLVRQLEQRVAAKTRGLYVQLAVSALGVALVVYMALSFYLSFAGAVRALHRGVGRVAAGDLSQRIQIDGKDELAEIGQLVEGMNHRLSALVA